MYTGSPASHRNNNPNWVFKNLTLHLQILTLIIQHQKSNMCTTLFTYVQKLQIYTYRTEVTGTTTACAATIGPRLARLLANTEVSLR